MNNGLTTDKCINLEDFKAVVQEQIGISNAAGREEIMFS